MNQIFRTDDAFHARRCEGPYRFAPPPRTFAPGKKHNNRLSRDFRSSWISDFFNSIGTTPTCWGGLTMSVDRGRPEGASHAQSDAIDPLTAPGQFRKFKKRIRDDLESDSHGTRQRLFLQSRAPR